MGKKRRLVIGVVVALALGLFALIYRRNISSIRPDELIESTGGLSLSTILFFSQWVVLLILGAVIYSRFAKKEKEEKSKIQSTTVRKRGLKTETDFDTLYELLKEKKNLSIGAISKLLKIKKELVLTWVKILESNEIVSIEYPMFGDPVVVLKVKKKAHHVDNVKKKGDLKKNKLGIKKSKGIFGFFKKNKKVEIVENPIKPINKKNKLIVKKKSLLKNEVLIKDPVKKVLSKKVPVKKVAVKNMDNKVKVKKAVVKKIPIKAKPIVKNATTFYANALAQKKSSRNLKTVKTLDKKNVVKKIKNNGGNK